MEIKLQERIELNIVIAEYSIFLSLITIISLLISHALLTQKIALLIKYASANSPLILSDIVAFYITDRKCAALHVDGTVTYCGMSLVQAKEHVATQGHNFLQVSRSSIINYQHRNLLSIIRDNSIEIRTKLGKTELAYTNSHTREIEILLN